MKSIIKIKNVYDFINEIAPFTGALDYDNVGLLAGDRNSAVDRIMLSLDITFDVIEESIAENAQLIISHHPVIFEPIKNVTEGNKLFHLIKNGISAICAHTNLDIAQEGINDVLFEMLGLHDMKWLSVDNTQAIGRWGTLKEPVAVKDFALFVKKLLNANVVRYVEGNRHVKNVAVVSGAGGSDYKTALICGADTLVTGDSKYNAFLEAYEAGFNIIEAGHFSTENIILPLLKKKLEDKFPETEILISKKHRNLIDIV